MEPKEKEKFTVLKSDDLKAQIFYQELEFSNYMFTEDTLNEWEIEDPGKKILSEEEESSGIWTLEFGGSCSSSCSSVGVVLIPPKREPEPMDFKFEFGNKNNIAKYEALLLRIIAMKEKEIKILRARGDAELIVK